MAVDGSTVMSNLRWKVGNVSITQILDMEFGPVAGPDFAFPEATPDAVSAIDWLKSPFVDEAGRLFLSFHALLIETPSLRILVDTCVGNDKQRGAPGFDALHTRFLEEFEATGVSPEAVNIVVCTHLHLDHVGWNTRLVDKRWVPTFSKARTLMGRVEFEYWREQQVDKIHRLVFADSVQPLWDAGLIDLVDTDHRICSEVSLEPTPGHSPGHVSVRIRSEGAEALITGDSIHHPIQLAHPEWCLHFDYDKTQSFETRKRLFADCVARNVLMIGTHFMAPTAGRVRQKGDAFWFDTGNDFETST